MTERIKAAVRRRRIVAPAWAVHFHVDVPSGKSAPCYDERCGQPPLSTDYRHGE